MFKKSTSFFLVMCFLVSVVSIGFAENSYVVVPAQKTFVSAESRLKDLSKKAEEGRTQSAMYGIGLGLLYISLGSALGKSSYGTDYSGLYYAMGAGMSILGIKSLMFPTELENNYTQTRKMQSATVEERAAREKFSEDSLRKGADEANRGRIILSGIMGAFGLATLSSGYGILYAGLGAVSYFMKSDIEKSYDEYVTDKEDFIKSQPATPVVVPATNEVETKQTSLEGETVK